MNEPPILREFPLRGSIKSDSNTISNALGNNDAEKFRQMMEDEFSSWKKGGAIDGYSVSLKAKLELKV